MSVAQKKGVQLAQENGIVSHIVEYGQRHKMTHFLVTIMDGNLSLISPATTPIKLEHGLRILADGLHSLKEIVGNISMNPTEFCTG